VSARVLIEIGFVIGNTLTRPAATAEERQFILGLDALPVVVDLLNAARAVVRCW
jgi:hypothetical protein